ncbi:MAG: YHS domain-containing protein, partial [Candidatus Omnitrophica bacterium]|nr:YHS domain-containing protein [Candidatus Omnitrophota bacterium]
MSIDPICGMQVSEDKAIKITHDGKDYFFCSTHCRDRFIKQEGMKDAAVCYPALRKPLFKNKLFIISCIPVILILASLFIPFLMPFRKAFLNYLKIIWWAVTLGLFLGGIIDYYIPREYISKILSHKRPTTIFNAVFLGFLMSACSHGI